MVKTFTFGSRQAANSIRDIGAVTAYLDVDDDRREKTVKLKPDAPDSIVQRLEQRAFVTGSTSRASAGQAKLSDSERQSLQRTQDSFNWQDHGLEAMRTKAALERKGATEWIDFYEPGEGVEGAMKNLKASKERSAETGANIGVGGDFTDEEEMGAGRMRQQTERMQAQQVKGAKDPAILQQDTDAQGFLREEQEFEGDVFDIAFSRGDSGRVEGSGRDYERLQDRNAQRSDRAQELDDLRAAPKTRDPFEWANNPAQFDFPGIDTLDPAKVHDNRSERAQEMDESRQAEVTNDPVEWADNPDDLDFPGVDTPSGQGSVLDTDTTGQVGLGGDMTDSGGQAAFDVETDVRDAQGQGTRIDEPSASEFGVDDRALEDDVIDPGEETGLEQFGGGARENESLDDLL